MRPRLQVALLLVFAACGARAGTRLVATSPSNSSMLVVDFAGNDARYPHSSTAILDHPADPFVSLDGSLVGAWEQGSGELAVVDPGSPGILHSIVTTRPGRGSWIYGGNLHRAINMNGVDPQLIDLAAGSATHAAGAGHDDVSGCVQEPGDDIAICLASPGVAVSVDGDGHVIRSLATGQHLAIGADGTVIVADTSHMLSVRRSDGHVVAFALLASAVDVVASDLASRTLLTVDHRIVTLYDLGTLGKLRELVLPRDIVAATLLQGGRGFAALDDGGFLSTYSIEDDGAGSGGDPFVRTGVWYGPFDAMAAGLTIPTATGTSNDEVADLVESTHAAVDGVASQLDARLDVAVSTRATQASVDALATGLSTANGRLDAAVTTRATQSSVDALATGLATANGRLDVAVSTRATQASVDGLATGLATANGRLDAAVSTRATQASVDGLATGLATANGRLDAAVSTRATQASVDGVASAVAGVATDVAAARTDIAAARTEVGAARTDIAAARTDIGVVHADVVDVGSDVNGIASDVTDVATDVSGVASDVTARLDVAVSTRATQTSVNDLAAGVSRANAQLDVASSTRASQASVDGLVDNIADDAARAADERARLLEAIGLSARRGIESSLLAGIVEPMFLVPAGADGDPAVDGLTCPGLPPAGQPSVHRDGLFETVRCVTRRSIDALRALGEDVRQADHRFAEAEADRMASPPRYRDAVDGYSRALDVLARGH